MSHCSSTASWLVALETDSPAANVGLTPILPGRNAVAVLHEVVGERVLRLRDLVDEEERIRVSDRSRGDVERILEVPASATSVGAVVAGLGDVFDFGVGDSGD